MNFKLILNIAGIVLIIISPFMTLPVIVSLIYKQPDAIPLMESFLITLLSGVILFFLTKKHKKEEIRHRDAFIIVTTSWVVMAFSGALPFMLSGSIPSLTDAVFESMSGFTTTGASILTDIEVLPKGVLFWRSLTHWMGGMGIIVMSLAIMPMLGTGGMQLFKAEASEVVVEKLRPRIIDTAKSLYIVYLLFTLIGILLLWSGGMNLYDAICHCFSALATGGYSTKNLSIAYYKSAYIDYVIIFLMFVGGTNFSLHYYAFKGVFGRYIKSNEFIFYFAVTIVASLLITISIYFSEYYKSIPEAFRYALFQAVSIMTATGYVTSDFEKWPVFTQTLLVALMFLGGMVGSTAGGIKQVRILLALKQMFREFYHLIHPRAVTFVKLDGKELPKEVLGSVWGFIFLFISIWVLSTLAMTALGVDIVTSATTVVSAMSNVGPALGSAGPMENYSTIPLAGKWVLTICMLIGRLEIYTVIILFVPHFWKK
ncbi:MAG: TrkH family potassium uptake protein [Nitrospirae bacterium]|nr:TrkH family potassium uptake protein [Nitrospirota bacterium]